MAVGEHLLSVGVRPHACRLRVWRVVTQRPIIVGGVDGRRVKERGHRAVEIDGDGWLGKQAFVADAQESASSRTLVRCRL